MTDKRPHQTLLDKEALLAAPEEEYMNIAQRAYFKQVLVDLYDATQAHIEDAKQQMKQPHDSSDANDLASWQEQSNFALRIVDREQKLLPKIKEALARIRLETYGYCEESGEPIGIGRLLARPTAIFGSDVKLLKEIEEESYRKP